MRRYLSGLESPDFADGYVLITYPQYIYNVFLRHFRDDSMEEGMFVFMTDGIIQGILVEDLEI